MIPYSRDLEVELPWDENDILNLAADPYLRPYNALTDKEGEIIYEDMTEVVLTFRSEMGDIYNCSGLRLFRRKFELVIPDFPVIVNNWDEANIDYPLQLYWSPVEKTAYPGEIISLILNLRYTENLEFPESITMKKPPQGTLEQVDLPGSIEPYELQDKTVYTYPLESWYFSSGEAGKLTIPGGSVEIMGLARSIPTLEIDILPLPEEVRKSGAVGDLSLITHISQDKAVQGEIVTLTIRIEGTGNFPYLNFPEVSSEGFGLINTDEKEELLPTEGGYTGFREITYRFQAGRDSVGQISCEPYFWFNPVKDELQSYPGDTYDMNITGQGGLEEDLFELLSPSLVEWVIFKEFSQGPLMWVLLLPGLIYFLISLFSLNDKSKSSLFLLLALPFILSMAGGGERKELIKEAQHLYDEGALEECRQIYNTLLEDKQWSAYYFNLAVLDYYGGDIVESEIYFRKGLLALPGDRNFTTGIGKVEELADLKDQYMVNWLISRWSLQLILILMLNLFLVALSFYLKRKELSQLLIMSSLFFLSLITAGGLVLMDSLNERPQAIVESGGAQLYRIPEESALTWLNLPQGTSLRLVAEQQGFYFIKTGYGLEGWIETGKIVPLGSE
ncbi:MAG: hypothetical protein PQJ59_07270 [Spirochaetales bacterium]|nr:hypothetical protein [Spirochaetales bacterium]